ncbi:MAG: hypothetical protein ACM3ML_30730 [Micromonosporaceae bacterium]
MSHWMWLNIPLCAIAFIATVGIPMWVLFNDPGHKKSSPGGRRPPGRRRRDYELAV